MHNLISLFVIISLEVNRNIRVKFTVTVAPWMRFVAGPCFVIAVHIIVAGNFCSGSFSLISMLYQLPITEAPITSTTTITSILKT